MSDCAHPHVETDEPSVVGESDCMHPWWAFDFARLVCGACGKKVDAGPVLADLHESVEDE